MHSVSIGAIIIKTENAAEQNAHIAYDYWSSSGRKTL